MASENRRVAGAGVRPDGCPAHRPFAPGRACFGCFLRGCRSPVGAEPRAPGGDHVPGYAGTPAPADDSVENYAREAGRLAAAIHADVVVGHSVGANIALEMASTHEFSGPLVLISPSFSRKDESIAPRVMDRLATLLVHLPFTLVLKLIGKMVKGELPDHRHAALAAELENKRSAFRSAACTRFCATTIATEPSLRGCAKRGNRHGSCSASMTIRNSRIRSVRLSRRVLA